ncbi:MAG: hypothetical protein RL422_97 [Bacteroidota bacterium]|jgi:hypothetical protein
MPNTIETLLKDSGSVILGRQGSLTEWFIGLIGVLAFTYIYRILYIKYSSGIGNKNAFASQFFLFSLAIYLIISSIKASLVLSLGLVGALSVVRFRNAIKDTEQIIYLLFLIALSLSIAANQYLLGTISGIIGIIYLTTIGIISSKPIQTASIYVEFENPSNFKEIIENLSKHENSIISINSKEEKLIISATFNNYTEIELLKQTSWLSKEAKEFRIVSN